MSKPTDQCLTVDRVLGRMRERGLERRDAQLLVAHVLGARREWVLAHGDAQLGAEQARRLEVLADRRREGEPLAYLIGCKEFRGLPLQVTPDVLVPRPETETLVEWAIAVLHGELADRAMPRVLDLGTGSGAIALAIKSACPRCTITAVDASPQALEIAGTNAQRLSLPVEFICSDWWQGIHGRQFDLVLGNPPYIAEDDPHLADLSHEPRRALASGVDGLEAITHIVRDAPDHLGAGAWLLLEHGYDQASRVRDLLGRRGFRNVESRHDLAGMERCSGGRHPGA